MEHMSLGVKWGLFAGGVIVVAILTWLYRVPYAGWIVFGFAMLWLSLWYFLARVFVRIDELELGVVFNRETGAFSRFLPAGRHLLIPYFEYLKATLDLSFQAASGTTKGAHTAEGLPVEIDWWMSYQLTPLTLSAEMKKTMSRALPNFAEGMAKNHGINCLQQVVEQFTVEELCRPGIQVKLEEKFLEKVAARLAPFGFFVPRVMIHKIQLPQDVLNAVEEAHERDIQAQALKRLYEVLDQFDDNTMSRLEELERMRMLGKHGVTLVYPMATLKEGAQPGTPANSGQSPAGQPARGSGHKP